MLKESIRKSILSLRLRQCASHALKLSALIRNNIRSSSFYRRSSCIMSYWPVSGEPDLRPLMRSKSKKFYLPKISDSEITALKYESRGEMIAGAYGIPEPTGSFIEPGLDLVLVPGIAFDRTGARVGFGKGYYDRFLRALSQNGPCVTVGVCFDFQIVKKIPAACHDFMMDWLVTEKGAFKCC